MFPSPNGFAFLLKLNNVPNLQVLANFEEILTHNSQFSYYGEPVMRKTETSPDDKLYRHKPSDTGFFEMVSETIKSGIEKIKIKKENITTGTKGLTSRKKRINLKEIKNKKFRKEARPTFKKDFFETSEKHSLDFYKMRRENPNLFECRQLSDLTKGNLPSIYNNKDELEDSILTNKELAASGKVNLVVSHPLSQETKGKETISGRETKPGLRETTGKVEPTKLPTFEHYSG